MEVVAEEQEQNIWRWVAGFGRWAHLQMSDTLDLTRREAVRLQGAIDELYTRAPRGGLEE